MDAVQVRRTVLAVPGAALGAEGHLPHVEPIRELPATALPADAPRAMRERAAHGRLRTALPYPRYGDYDRSTEPRELAAIEVTNGAVTATVLPGLGGRVWSLYDHAIGRELLHRNPVLRFANFGLTDAWFAGGIEWNLGSTGHSCLTTRPMHAAVVRGASGDVLRLWEWERTRDLVLQVDLTLDGRRLVASTRVVNPDPEEKPLYYWTNIAVPETPGTRVLCPAGHAWRSTYTGELELVPLPHPTPGEPDVSRPLASEYAADYFFDVGDQEGRLVTAVGPDGVGLAQTSTSALVGRKLFVWGHGPGGSRWQEWLSGPGTRYCEIQAGACPTQLEHDRLAGAVSWTETFGAVELDPAVVSGDYETACAAAAAAVHGVEPPALLEARHQAWLAGVADRRPDEVLATGSGWGHAELLLRGGHWSHDALPFPEVPDGSRVGLALLGAEDPTTLDRAAWLLAVPPVSDRWFALLRRRQQHWWVDYALAVNHHVRGQLGEAERLYRRSNESRATAGAHRGLAHAARARGDDEAAVDHYEDARRLEPKWRDLATEHLELLLELGRTRECLAVEERLPDAVRRHGRTRLLRARALALSGSAATAASVMDDLVVEDLPEGARDLDELWAEIHPDRPLPARMDFRMVREEGTR